MSFVYIAQERRENYKMGRATRKLYRDMEDNINEKTNSMMSLPSMDEMLGNHANIGLSSVHNIVLH